MKSKSDLTIRYVLICDDIREEKSGKETLVGVYKEKIYVGNLPALLPKLCFRSYITPAHRPVEVTISIQPPPGGDITTVKGVIPAMVEDWSGHILSLIISPMVFKVEGEYLLVMEYGDKKETALKFFVELKKELPVKLQK